MKRIMTLFLVLALAICVSAQEKKASGEAKKKEAKSGSKMNDSKLTETLLAQEKALWEAWASKNTKAFDEWLAPNVVGIDAMGVSDKAAVLKMVGSANCKVNSFKFMDEKLTWIDKDAVVVTFKAWQDGTCDGQKLPENSYVMSTWKKAGGKWWGIAHAEVPAMPPPSGK